jgi:hypothetical protein
MASVRKVPCVSPSVSQIQKVNDWSTWTNEKGPHDLENH